MIIKNQSIIVLCGEESTTLGVPYKRDVKSANLSILAISSISFCIHEVRTKILTKEHNFEKVMDPRLHMYLLTKI